MTTITMSVIIMGKLLKEVLDKLGIILEATIRALPLQQFQKTTIAPSRAARELIFAPAYKLLTLWTAVLWCLYMVSAKPDNGFLQILTARTADDSISCACLTQVKDARLKRVAAWACYRRPAHSSCLVSGLAVIHTSIR